MIVHSGSNRRYFAQSVHSGEKMRGSGRDESSKSFGIEDPGLGTQLRTRDPLLQQKEVRRKNSDAILLTAKRLVDVAGIEPATPCLQSRCSPS